MTTLITGDIHWSAQPKNEYRFKLVDWLKREIKARKVQDLIILGDITDVKDEHGSWLVNMVVDSLTELAELCFITIPTGNHDYVNSELPFFEFVRNIKNIDWVHAPRVDSYKDLDNVLILPHDHAWKANWPKHLKAKHDTVLTHCAIAGAKGYFGGDCVPVELFKGQGRVLAGDNHVPQTFENVTYVGAPYTINFGDDYMGRVLLFDHSEMTSLPVGGPQKKLLTVSSLKELDKQAEWTVAGDVVRVKYKLKPSEREHWRDIKRDIAVRASLSGCRIEVVPESELPTADRKAKKIDYRSDEELVRAYSQQTGLPLKIEERGLYLLGKAPQ